MMISRFKTTYQDIKNQLKESTFDNLIWIVNIVPNLAGFSIRHQKIAAPFWIVHLSLLAYVYGAGSLVFQLKVAQSVEDFIKSYVNVSLLTLLCNMSFWWLHKRSILRETLKLLERSDREASRSEFRREKHTKLLHRIKLIMLLFYIMNYLNATFIYLPHRVNVNNDYSMVPCVGLEPLTSFPKREICLTILLLQEFSIMVVALNYQVLLLFLIAHTSAMYVLLSEEIMDFNNFTDLKAHRALVREKLPDLIRRHSSILLVCENLKSLYSVAIGVDFGSNAVCICLFFYMPLHEWLKYMPILAYCALAFFLYCFLCQRMTNASEVFERAVYSCGWENFDVREQKLVYVMMRQAQKPVIILAADIIPVNMYTFATTLQAMFKFVTVVKF